MRSTLNTLPGKELTKRAEREAAMAVAQVEANRRVVRVASAAALALLVAALAMGCHGGAGNRTAKPGPDTAKALALLREALATGEKVRDASAKADITREVIYTWAAVDPDDALRAAKRLPSDQQQRALRGAADALVVTDTKRGIELGRVIGYHFEDTDKISATAAALARVSPRDAVEFTFHWEEEQAAIACRATAETLVAHSPDSAVTLVQSQSDPRHPWKRWSLLASVVEVLARTDSARAMSLVEGIPDKDWRDGAMRGVVSAVAKVDPERALTMLPRIRDPNVAKWVRCDIVRGFARRDLPRALGMARNMEDPQRYEALAGISYELAATDADAALRVMRGIGEGWLRDNVAYYLAKTVAERNPRNAPEIARRIVDEAASYPPALFLALQIIAKADPDAALEIAVTNPGLADDVRWVVAGVVGTNHPDRAQSIAGQIINEVVRSEAFSDIARARAQADPADGIRIAEAIADRWARDRALAAIACDVSARGFDGSFAASRKIQDDALRAAALCALALKVAGREMPQRDEVP